MRYIAAILLAALLPSRALCGGIEKCDMADLRPTQISVGMKEVKKKARKLAELGKQELRGFEKENPEPAVLGPKGKYYIVDHHHLARALFEAGADSTYCSIIADFSEYDKDAFWNEMSARRWVYPYDENGHLRPYSDIPKHIQGLKNDIYRSLAYFVRKAGGYDKSDRPFAEFRWADFFRSRISRGELEDDFDGSVEKAVELAHSPQARELPGYRER
ncbi:MAG: ParB/Srx family N-terminal domain-containing protein [Elusimicrobiales bacterium]